MVVKELTSLSVIVIFCLSVDLILKNDWLKTENNKKFRIMLHAA